MIRVYIISGYEEVGKNMIVVGYFDGRKEEVVIIDMGIRFDCVFIYEDVNIQQFLIKEFQRFGVIFDDLILRNKKVVVIMFIYGYFDYIGVVGKIVFYYLDVLIYGIFYMIKLVKSEVKSEQYFEVKNLMYEMEFGEIVQVSENLVIEFVWIIYLIFQVVMVVVYIFEGVVVYIGDFKFDNNNLFGERFD